MRNIKRDEIFTALTEGKGDIAAANLTITPERLLTVDFTDPLADDVHEIVVTGPTSPQIQSAVISQA